MNCVSWIGCRISLTVSVTFNSSLTIHNHRNKHVIEINICRTFNSMFLWNDGTKKGFSEYNWLLHCQVIYEPLTIV